MPTVYTREPSVNSWSQPKSESEWRAKIDKLYSEHDRTKYYYERQWYLNIAFFLGHQWATWNEVTRRIEEPKVPSWRVRLVANRILPTIRMALAKITKNRPIMQCIPATSEEEDLNASKTAEKVLETLWRKLDLDVKTQDLVLWFLCASTSFFKVTWNPTAGPRMTYLVDQDGDPIISSQEEQIPQMDQDGIPVTKEFNLGEVTVDVVNPFEMFIDPVAKVGDPINWMMQAKVRTLDYIKEHYPEHGDEVAPEKDLSASSFFERRIMSLISTFSFAGVINAEEHEESAVVKEYWEKPSKKYPRGKVVTVANGVSLQEEDWPEEYLEDEGSTDFGPFVKFLDVVVPGRFWGMSTIEQLIPIQKQYNKSRSQIIETKNLMSKPKILEPRGSNIMDSALTSEPGERVVYTPIGGLKPEFWTPPPLPEYIFEDIKLNLQDFEEVSMIHQVSKGEAPAGVRAGIAIRFLQEMDDTGLGPVILRFERGLARTGTLMLRVVQEHYKEKRIMQVVGKNREVEVFDFKGADLRNCTDVVVQAGSAFPSMKSAKQQFVLDLYQQYQLFGNPADPQVRNRVLKLLEMGDIDQAYEDAQLDERMAELENRQMAKGIQHVPEFFEDHVEHLQTHFRYMKGTDWDKMPDQIKQIFYQHVQQTTQMAMPQPPPGMGAPPPNQPSASGESPPGTQPGQGGGAGAGAPPQGQPPGGGLPPPPPVQGGMNG